MRGAVCVGILLAGVTASSQWPSHTVQASSRGQKVEVRQFEMAYSPGKPGVKIRLTLATGQAFEYRVEDAAETETIGRLGSIFINGQARMFADVDGDVVLGVQIAGPFGYGPGH
jgi:hypothetical protein